MDQFPGGLPITSLTRDAVQGFIDGYKAAGGDLTATKAGLGVVSVGNANAAPDPLTTALQGWMAAHPKYPQTPENISVILSDLGTYAL